MGSLRAKQASYIEILKAIQLGQLQGLTRPDRLLASQIWNTLNKMEYDPDLKLYLPFDETSGATAHDLSGNGNTGTATGTTIIDGVFGKARSFNGTSDDVQVPYDASFGATNVGTIEIWVYPTETNNFILGYYTDDEEYFRLSTVGGIFTFIQEVGNVAVTQIKGDSNIVYDKWHLLAVTQNGTAAKLYIDAVLQTTVGANSGNWFNDNPASILHFGNTLGWGGYWFAGKLDEPRIYSRVLSADEIYLHYLAGALKLGLI